MPNTKPKPTGKPSTQEKNQVQQFISNLKIGYINGKNPIARERGIKPKQPPLKASIHAYGDRGVYHRDLKSIQRTFPRTHPKQSSHVFKGTAKETLKLGLKAGSAYLGVPQSYAALPITALFSDFGMEGEKRLNPDRAARLLGYKDANHQQLMIKAHKKKGGK